MGCSASVALDMEFRHKRVNVYFRLLLQALQAGIEINYINFENGSDDPHENTRALIEAIADARLGPVCSREAAATISAKTRHPSLTELRRASTTRDPGGAASPLQPSRASFGQDWTTRKSVGWTQSATGMTPVHLFGVLSQHNRWLSLRQATISGNIANANTPGYKGIDVEPFEKAWSRRNWRWPRATRRT